MSNNTQNILQTENWQDEICRSIQDGSFRERYKILVLVTCDSTGNSTGIAGRCAELFHRYGLLDEAQYDCRWLLEYLSAGKDRILYEDVVKGVKKGRKLQVITDLHQYFYSTQRTASVLKSIVTGLTGWRTEVPVVFLVRAQAFRWLYQTIGAESVLYLTDGSSVQYNAPEEEDEGFESVGNGDRRSAGPTALTPEAGVSDRRENSEKRKDGDPDSQILPWYRKRPDWLQFETERVRQSCAGYVDEQIHFLKDRRYAYWLFKYNFRDTRCRVLAIYHVDFPNADPDNITLMPLEPAFEDFRRLHGELLDYRYDSELKQNVISIRVNRRELQERWGYAEVAWKKLYSAMGYNNHTGRKKSFNLFSDGFFSLFQ